MESPSMVTRNPRQDAQPRIPCSVFEGLFVRGMAPHEGLSRALGLEGYDPRCPEMSYPVMVWKRCVDKARQLVYGPHGDAEAYRQLGRKLTEGFAETLVGRVAVVALPMIGPARVLERLPRFLAMMGRPDLEVKLVLLGERTRSITLADQYNRPEFIAGALEVALERAHARPILDVDDRSPLGFRLLVRW